MPIAVPALQAVKSSRFRAWAYDSKNHWLFVLFPASKRSPRGSIVYYEAVAPEQWMDAEEAESKGEWLGREIIGRNDRHPFHYVNGVEANIEGEETPLRASAIVENIVRGGFLGRGESRDRMGQTGRDNAEKMRTAGADQPGPATLEDMQHVPAPIRDVAQLPQYTVPKMPEILPPEVKDGEKPFTQVVRERAHAIATALPALVNIPDLESYRGLGAALVVIKTERRAVEEALEMISRPLIDIKRAWDEYKKAVLLAYETTENKLDQALTRYRREEERRTREREAEIRRQNEQKARERAAEESRAETARMQEKARQLEAEALEMKEQAATPQDVQRAEADLERAEQMKQMEVTVSPQPPPPVHLQREDLGVSGLRKKPAAWAWEPDPAALAIQPQEGQPLTRKHFKQPDLIPAEYWLLDETAVNGLVRNTKGLCQLHGIRTYDKNSQGQ